MLHCLSRSFIALLLSFGYSYYILHFVHFCFAYHYFGYFYFWESVFLVFLLNQFFFLFLWIIPSSNLLLICRSLSLFLQIFFFVDQFFFFFVRSVVPLSYFYGPFFLFFSFRLVFFSFFLLWISFFLFLGLVGFFSIFFIGSSYFWFTRSFFRLISHSSLFSLWISLSCFFFFLGLTYLITYFRHSSLFYQPFFWILRSFFFLF